MQHTFLKCTTRTQTNLPKFTMTQKCTFNPNPIWDQKWNYLDPCVRHITGSFYNVAYRVRGTEPTYTVNISLFYFKFDLSFSLSYVAPAFLRLRP